MGKYPAIFPGPQAVAVLVCLGLAGCASSNMEEPGILASERQECQKLTPPDYEDCLERARTGTVLHVPNSVWQRDRIWNDRRFD